MASANPTHGTHAEVAERFNKSIRTIYSWHERGLIDGYDDNGTIKFNFAAVELALKMYPARMRDGRRRGRGIIKPMPIQAEAVSE